MELFEDDGNKALEEFYQSNLSFFKKVLLCEISCIVLENMAIIIHSTIHGFEWQEYVEDMGIKNNFQILKIQSKSKLKEEEPIFTALRCALQHNRSFGDIIAVLLKRKRLDVLHHIKSYAERLLIKISDAEVKSPFSEQTNAVSFISAYQSSVRGSAESCCYDSASTASCSSSHDICFKFEQNNQKEKLLAESQTNENLFGESDMVKSQIVKLSKEGTGKSSEEANQNNLLLCSPPPYDNDHITVFITYAEADLSIAQSLSSALQRESFTVKLYSEMDYLSFMDPAGSIQAILWEVDFIVPVVSKIYLEQIHPKQNSTLLDSSAAVDNRYIYQLLQNEYRINRCLNFRVRPVILPNVDRRLLIYDMLLSSALRLWHEVPKLVKVLKKTKEKIPRFC